MIRKLHKELDIPLDVLMQSQEQTLCDEATAARYNRFPFNEMFNRGWFAPFFKGTLAEAKYRREEIFCAFAGKRNICMMPCAMNRKSNTDNVDDILLAWRLRVMNVAEKETLPKWDAKVLDNAFFRN